MIKTKNIENGIKHLKENTGFFGRIELLRQNPPLIIDVSHNPAGVKALVETLELHFPNIEKWNFVFACMADKDISTMLKEIKTLCNELICCSPKIERAASETLLEEKAKENGFPAIKKFGTVKDALDYALLEEKATIIAGSFYLIEEALYYLKEKNFAVNI